MRARIWLDGKAPFCADCHGSDCHVVGTYETGHVWLCGSCELLRQNPEAERRKNPPGLPVTWPRRKGKQKESLF